MSFPTPGRHRRRQRLTGWIAAVLAAGLAGTMGLAGATTSVAAPTPPDQTGIERHVTGTVDVVTPGGGPHTQIHVRTTWALTDGQDPQAGDWFTIVLPEDMSAQPSVPFWLMGPGGEYVAHATWSGRVATVVFTDYVQDRDGVHGTADFWTMLGGSHEDGRLHLEFQVGASRGDQDFEWENPGEPGPPGDPHSFFYKHGGFVNWDDQGVNMPDDAMIWVLKAPADYDGPATFTDTPSPGHELDLGKVTVRRGDMDAPAYTLTAGSEYTTSFAAGTLTVEVGAITVGPRQWLEVEVYTSITDQSLLDFVNDATFDGSTWSETATRYAAGGTGEGSERTHGKLLLAKSGEGGAALAGARFEILQGGTSFGMLTTRADGTAESGWLLPGDYVLVEREAPPGYILDPTPIPVTVGIGATPVRVLAENDPGGWIEVAKTASDTGDPVGGVVFEVTDGSGAVVATLTTDGGTGRARTGILPVGTYAVTETSSPDGYFVAAPVEAGIVFNAVTTVDVVNVAGGWIEVAKTASDTGEVLGGAVFEVTDGSGAVVATLTTNATTGRARTGMLPVGAYTVTETTAPEGYVLAAAVTADVVFNAVTEVAVADDPFVSQVLADDGPAAGALASTGSGTLVPAGVCGALLALTGLAMLGARRRMSPVTNGRHAQE